MSTINGAIQIIPSVQKSSYNKSSMQSSVVGNSFHDFLQSKKPYEQKEITGSTMPKKELTSSKKDTQIETKDQMKKTTNNKKIKGVDTQNEQKKEEIDSIEKEVISKIAKKLNISDEEVNDILDQLGLTSVLQLLSPQNLKEFMQKAMKVEDPLGLLKITDITSIIKDIKEILEDAQPTLEVSYEDFFTDDSPNEDVESDPNKGTNSINDVMDDPSKGNVIREDAPTVEVIHHEKTVDEKDENLEVKEEPVKSKQNNTIETDDKIVINRPEADLGAQNGIMDKQSFQTVLNQADSEVQSTPVKNQVDEVMKQIVEHVKIEIKPEISEMSIKLKPEYLGKLDLNIITEKGIITAQFVAESQKVKEIIEANFNQLKQSLEDQGIKVDQLQVSVGQDQSRQGSGEEARQGFGSKSSRRVNNMIANLMNGEEEVFETPEESSYLRGNQVDYTA